MAFVLRSMVLALGLVSAAPALAQQREAPPVDDGSDHIILGLGAGRIPDYEGSNDYIFSPIPAAIGRVGGFDFQLIGNRASIDLIPDGVGPGWNVQAGPVAGVNLNRTVMSRIDDARVKALGKVGVGIDLGGYVGIGRTGVITSDYDRLSVTVSYRHDVANASKSGIWTPAVSYMTPLSRKSMVALFASADRAEDGYAETYFGVTPAQSARSGLPVYTPKGGWKSWTAGIGGAMSLTGDLTHGLQLVAGGSYSRMLNDFGDSPLVAIAGSRNQWMGTAGLAFSF